MAVRRRRVRSPVVGGGATRTALNWIFLLALFAWAALSSPAGVFAGEAATPTDRVLPAALVDSDGSERRVREVIDGDTVVIDPPLDGAREVRLVGIQAPKLPLGRRGFVAWPMADEARAALAELVAGRDVRLVSLGTAVDRHGRVLAHVVRDDGLWIQQALLRQGFARVYTFPDNRALAAELYAAEREARDAGRGIWSDPWYAIHSPATVADDIGRFAVIEGRVVSAKRVSQRLYLNFGADWRSDFTIVVAARLIDSFREAGVDLAGLEGRQVRVRGWVEKLNGPMIDVTHPEQLEIVPEGGG